MRHVIIALALAAGICFGSPHDGFAQTGAARNAFLGPLRVQWEDVANMVMGIAEAIPEDKYDYRPSPQVRSSREMLQHLINENYTFMGAVAGDPPRDRSFSESFTTRPELLKALEDSYRYGAKVWTGLTEQTAIEPITFRNTQTARWVPALSMIADNMDHYGNLVVYLRVNGLVPPAVTAARRFASGD